MKISLRLLTLSLALIFAASCTSGSDEASEADTSQTTVGLLQHNVYFYLKEEITEDEKMQFEEGLEELMSIEEVFYNQIGKPGSTAERDVTDHSFGYSIFSWFQTMEDYEVYAEHPVHLEFIEEYSELWVDVKVYDSEIIGESEN